MKAVRLNEIYRTYKNEVDFFCAYIVEAHPEDSVGAYRSEFNANQGITIDQPTTVDERADVAEMCVLKLNLEMPMLLDDMTDQINEGYRAAPDRLYLVDADGRIAYRGELGPRGFLPDEWEAAIKSLIGVEVAE